MEGRTNNELVFAGYYVRHDSEREVPSQADLNRYLEADDTEGLLTVLQRIECEWAESLRKSLRVSGLKLYEAAELLKCDRASMVRFMQGKTDRVPFPSLVTIAELTGRSIEQIFYKQDLNPLLLPRKHMAWIRRVKELSIGERVMAGIMLGQMISPGNAPSAAMERAGLVGRRLVEYAGDAAIRLEDLGREKGLFLGYTHRQSLRYIGRDQPFLARTPVLMLYGLMAGCALDYYLCWDYSGYAGKFADKDGREVLLDRTERDILSLLLRCDDPMKMNEAIGWLCAAAEDEEEQKNIRHHMGL